MTLMRWEPRIRKYYSYSIESFHLGKLINSPRIFPKKRRFKIKFRK